MSKNTFFTGQPIFSQILSLVPKDKVLRIACNREADKYCKNFTTHAHLVTFLYAIFNRCESLREVITGLLAAEQKLNHLGLSHSPRRSTLSDANTRRSSDVFGEIYQMLYDKYRTVLPDSRTSRRNKRTYLVDSTSIALFKEILKGTGGRSLKGKRKGGIKVHTLMRADEDVPQLIRYTARAAGDVPFLKAIKLPPGSILVFDRAYNNYSEWNRLNDEKITWVTRLRKDTSFRILKELPISQTQKDKGVVSIHLIDVGNTKDRKISHVEARLIAYKDKDSDKTFEFITNNRTFAPRSIADLYRKRWQIEVLFKRLKQNYPLRSFLGDTENAIELQIWATLIADLLLKIIKENGAKKWAFSNLVGMVRLHLLTYIDLFSFLKHPEKALRNKHKIDLITPNKLSLFPT
jgi:hypothetical protein